VTDLSIFDEYRSNEILSLAYPSSWWDSSFICLSVSILSDPSKRFSCAGDEEEGRGGEGRGGEESVGLTSNMNISITWSCCCFELYCFTFT
jgi:hypothetical protein